MYPSTKKVNTTFIWIQVFSIILFVFYVPVIYLEDFPGRSFDVTGVPDWGYSVVIISSGQVWVMSRTLLLLNLMKCEFINLVHSSVLFIYKDQFFV